MPIRVQNDLPVRSILEGENIFVMDMDRATHQNIRPIKIGILNLMPLKEDTELHILRSLSNTPLQVDVTFIMVKSHEAKNTSKSHINKFYVHFEDIKREYFDGLIITGAPVEMKEYEEVDYWPELCEIMQWTKRHVTSTLHVCWGAQAGLYYHYGIKKYNLPMKVFGVYPHYVQNRKHPLVRGFDDVFMAPHSRHTECRTEDIEACEDLVVLAKSDEVGVLICMSKDTKNIFIMGHFEYDRLTLDKEYRRDLEKGLQNVAMPVNYYPNNDINQKPNLMWRSHCNTFYSNWLNYYVYQETPYTFDGFIDEDLANEVLGK